MTLEERFWAKVDASGKCWVWTAATNGKGYGTISVRGKVKLAHRVAVELTRGPIPPGKVVMHTCDNKACVNPSHLRVATQAENVADAVRKGRHQFGENNGRAKLTEDDVVAIRQEYEPYRMSFAKLSKKYGVGEEQVRNIVYRVNWAHVE